MRRLGLQDGPSLRWWGGWNGEVPALDSRLIFDWTKACVPRPVIVVDSLAAFAGGDENNASDMRAFMHQARRLADLGAGVIVIHHDGKADSARDYRGRLGLQGRGRSSLSCNQHQLRPREVGPLRPYDASKAATGSQARWFTTTPTDGWLGMRERTHQRGHTAEELTRPLRLASRIGSREFEEKAAKQSLGRQRAPEFLANGVLAHVIRREDAGRNRLKHYLRRFNEDRISSVPTGSPHGCNRHAHLHAARSLRNGLYLLDSTSFQCAALSSAQLWKLMGSPAVPPLKGGAAHGR